MPLLTTSEAQFEQFCNYRGYPFIRIDLPTNFGRRADYRIHTPAGDAICEIKQLENTKWEDAKDEELRISGHVDLSRSIGKRAREMIHSAAPQLKKHRNEGVPLLVFGLDLTWHGYLSECDIDAGMHGQPQVKFHLSKDGQPNGHSSFGHGGGRQMTNDSRRYVSAICVMNRHDYNLTIYHNYFAETPLWPRYFHHPDDRHYIKGAHPETAGHVWLEFIGDRQLGI